MINMEQSRKVATIEVSDQHMIKWKITDKPDFLQCISDNVEIDNYKFIFYAERNVKLYKGLKVYTCLMKQPSKVMQKGHSRNLAPILARYDSAPYKNASFSQESSRPECQSVSGEYKNENK